MGGSGAPAFSTAPGASDRSAATYVRIVRGAVLDFSTVCTTPSNSRRKRFRDTVAGAVVGGKRIVRGETSDTNGPWLRGGVALQGFPVIRRIIGLARTQAQIGRYHLRRGRSSANGRRGRRKRRDTEDNEKDAKSEAGMDIHGGRIHRNVIDCARGWLPGTPADARIS